MKKLIAVLLALIICAGFSWAAAEDAAAEEIPLLGITFTYPRSMIDAKGIISAGNAAQLGDGVYYDYWFYSAMTREEMESAWAGDEQAAQTMQEKSVILFYVFAVAEGKDFSAVTAVVGDSLEAGKEKQIAKAGDWTYYLYPMVEKEFAETLDKEYADEYMLISSSEDEIIASFSFSAPFNEYGEMDGKVISFTATDLDGNEISSAEVFAQHAITMVNIWATWCGPCVGELAELQAIHTRFLEKDCAVLGLLTDRDVDACRSLMEENGVTYQVVMAPDDFSNYFPYDGVPTSFFVDRNGAFLGTKIVGAYPEMYEDALEPLLKK